MPLGHAAVFLCLTQREHVAVVVQRDAVQQRVDLFDHCAVPAASGCAVGREPSVQLLDLIQLLGDAFAEALRRAGHKADLACHTPHARRTGMDIFPGEFTPFCHVNRHFHSFLSGLCVLRQHRTIWQEHSAKDFASYESYKRAGILYVFPPFITARMGQKIGRRPQTQLCGDALSSFSCK